MSLYARLLLLPLVVALACTGSLDDPTTPAYTNERPSRPNVLLIVTDDQRATGTLQVMPTVRRLFVDQGTRFTHAYATTPLCCPSRSSIFSGRYAHSHGVRTNYVTVDLDHDKTLQAVLKEAGYLTAVSGKYLNQWPADVDPPLFDRWSIPLEVGYYEIPFNIDGDVETVEGYTNDLIEQKALEYLDDFETEDDKPWFLVIGTPAAHSLYEPEARYEDAPLPRWDRNKTMYEKDLSDKPPYISEVGERFGARRVHRLQLRTLMSADDLVRSVFDRLGAQHETRDTIAVFLSDNGQMWGDHGITGKRAPYLGSISVPLMVRWAGKVEQGATDGRLAATIDVAPTVLDAVDLETPNWMEGLSLLSGDRRQRLLLEHWTDLDTDVPDWASTLTKDYQYIEYYGAEGVTFREYYDLRTDPWQLRNPLGDDRPGNDPNLEPLYSRLAADRTCRGASCP